MYLIFQPDSETANVAHVEMVTIQRTGKRGRPRKVPNVEFLREAMKPGRHIKKTKLSRSMRMTRGTLRQYLNKYGIDHGFSTISDSDLDDLVRRFRRAKPDSGTRYLVGRLRVQGLRVQKRRVKASIDRIDPLGQVLRRREPTRRSRYKVSRPNALWHLDGHHKLIRWGIVIHGIIDGFCRTVSRVISVISIQAPLDPNFILSTARRASSKHQQPCFYCSSFI